MEVIAISGTPLRPKFADAMLSPIRPRSCLSAQLPLRFHGLYEAMAIPGIVLTPAGAPDIDVLSHDSNDPKLIDDALEYANVYEWCGAEKDKIVQQIRQLLVDRHNKLEDWRIWQISIEQDYTLGFHLENRKKDVVHQLTTVRIPLPLQLDVNFRILEDGHRESWHKIYLATRHTKRYGREIKVAEWIIGQKPVQVTWWLDAGDLSLEYINQTSPETLDHLKDT